MSLGTPKAATGGLFLSSLFSTLLADFGNHATITAVTFTGFAAASNLPS